MGKDGNCTLCGVPLTRRKWNSITDILYCNNVDCKEWHSPIVPPEVKGKYKPKIKTTLPAWFGESSSPLVNRAYRLRLALEEAEIGGIDKTEE